MGYPGGQQQVTVTNEDRSETINATAQSIIDGTTANTTCRCGMGGGRGYAGGGRGCAGGGRGGMRTMQPVKP